MNWTNYKLLVDYITALPPAEWDHTKPFFNTHGAPCGCYAAHIRARLAPELAREEGTVAIAQFLSISPSEADELWYPRGTGTRGVPGIREALRRLSVVAARYGGPPQEIAPQPFVGDEQAFLRSLRALVDHPHETVEQE